MIRKILDLTYGVIEKNKYLARTKPFVDAADSFFYGMPEVTADAPHVRDNLDIKRYMILVVVALLPLVALSVYLFGYYPLVLIAVSYAFGIGAESIFSIVRKEEINEGAFVTCMLFPLTLPPTTPWWVCAIGIVFGIVIGKEVFGGTGKNLFNPALVGRCFIFLCFPLFMTGESAFAAAENSPASFTGATPLAVRSGITLEDVPEGKTLADMRADVESKSLRPLFCGDVGGSVGETSAILILLGGLALMAMKIASWRTIVAVLGSAAFFSLILNQVNPETFAGPLFTLVSGGLMFGAVFMATDPVSGPVTSKGKWIYGILIGLLVVVIRGLAGYPEAAMFAILLANIFAPMLDEMVVSSKYKRKKAAI